ncbi:calmodulin-binding transcription activator 2-like isoform X1 [Gossypium australe]|uniref:Calmodulin-binding transcription activator 2-like isoform X1 n=1 Tax=Gossypium australe TaxID=47621 RepID=A0A5B6WKZ7_9ROSI|nr:calmodulin-binding transcription activator 2-like isoform X1 [Gossypium australe]
MADRASYSLAPRLDIDQILLEAQHRWLRPAEICEILRNYQKFHISSEPPTGPPSGSLFLFDRKVLRYFRKDGHNWRKKKDGKTVKEAHEKLKVGSIDVLHCYYAHGEENENFQRRSYWMLEQYGLICIRVFFAFAISYRHSRTDLTHIVFVHYLEVKGRTIGGISHVSNSQTSSPSTSSYPDSHTKAPSGNADSASPTSTLTSLCEDADSEDSHQASSRFCTLPQQGNASVMDKIDSGFLNHYSPHQYPGWSSIPGVNEVSHLHGDRPRDIDYGTCTTEARRTPDLPSWEQDLGQYLPVCAAASFHTSTTSTQPNTMSISLQQQNMMKRKLLTVESASAEFGNSLSTESNWQIPSADNALELPKWLMDSSSNFELPYDTRFFEQKTHDFQLPNTLEEITNHDVLKDDGPDSVMKTYPENDVYLDGNVNYALSLKKSLLSGEENLKKVDSFSRWITKELGEVDDLQMQSSSGLAWSTVECGNVSDGASLSPSLSQDQLFSMVDFSPKWAYVDLETEVLIIGTFLKSQEEVAKYNWSCMFGEVEVPAEIIADGILSCYAPPHNVGQVPFYVTCSNRVACSEVREFDYRAGVTKDINVFEIYGLTSREMLLRLKTLLSLKSFSPCNHHCQGVVEKRELIAKIISMKEEEECHQFVDLSSDQDLSEYEEKERLLQRLIKEKLYSWLLHKIMEDGKGPNILDEKGQGVLHLAAALGYDWAINPIVSAGVSINFRDVNGWTALHWAAFCGRQGPPNLLLERTVAILVSVGAAPGALTDPSPEFPLGRTPADLASANGHKGISGFLAESSLTSYLSSLTMDDQKEAVQTVSDRIATSVSYSDAQDILSLKDSITAVCNATQAADRIHQMFRMQSFQWKQLRESSDGLSDEHVISLLTTKTRRPFQSDGVAHAAATQIQKKFRGWKKRKEFLLIRQRIVKIQAHVRGHQVRKQYKTFVWSVGILEKVILRWRRKGSGLRGFRRDAIIKPDPQCTPPEEDEYDFLKEGRKQTEERFQKALTRVKSMAQNPEGRGQYRRLLTLVQGIQENKACNMVLNSTEEVAVADEDFLYVDSLLDDDTFMSIAFE